MFGLRFAAVASFVAAIVLFGLGLNQGNTVTIAVAALVVLLGILLGAFNRGLVLLTQIRNSVNPPKEFEWVERSAEEPVGDPDETTNWDGNQVRYKGYTVFKEHGKYFAASRSFSTFGKAKRHINSLVGSTD